LLESRLSECTVLDDQDLKRLRAQLDARAAELRDEVRAVDAETEGTPSSIAHSHVEDAGERGEERFRSALRHAEKERDIAELHEIDAAYERMAQGSYGLCIDCGADIAPARLAVQPAGARCLACQERFEQSHAAAPKLPPII
jgi:DnaK suppressor protein